MRLFLIKLFTLQSDRHNYPSVNVRAVYTRVIKGVTEEKKRQAHTNTRSCSRRRIIWQYWGRYIKAHT